MSEMLRSFVGHYKGAFVSLYPCVVRCTVVACFVSCLLFCVALAFAVICIVKQGISDLFVTHRRISSDHLTPRPAASGDGG